MIAGFIRKDYLHITTKMGISTSKMIDYLNKQFKLSDE